MSDDERSELVRLRAEVARLRRPNRRWRNVTGVILVVLGCLVLPFALTGVWAAAQVSDTSRYVENVAPLASDPQIQAAVTDRVTNEIMKYLNVPAILNDVVTALEGKGLPPKVGDRLEGLAGPLAGGVRGFLHDKIGDVVRSDAFRRVWIEVNKVAHTQLQAVLSGHGSQAIKLSGNTVNLDLGPIINRVKQRLVAAGLGVAANIPDIHPTIKLFSSPDLVKWQTAYQWLTTLRWVLPIVALVLIVLGVYVAPSHRRVLVGAGLGVGVAMFAVAVGLTLGRSAYLTSIGEHGLKTVAGADVFDTLVRFLRSGLRTILVLGLVVAAAAFMAGPSVTAVNTRAAVTSGIVRLRRLSHLETGRVGAWLHLNIVLARIAVVAVAVLVFVFWDRPTGLVVLVIALLTLVALGLLELVACA
ncbi:hypothetical protein J5X84_29175 [Streptosporangiaceae bacterium NEAU-GS5]|nr:hypothetical protein [Streptosporangiaceae bacterium NEAU-GS5]